MPKVKTIELAGTETAVTFPQNHPYYMILNMGGEELYVSGNPGIVPYADGVYAVPAGTEIRVSPEASGDTIWLLGSGRVQVRAEEIAAQTSFRSRGKGGGDGGIIDLSEYAKKEEVPISSEVINSSSTNKTVSTSKAVFDYVISMLASAGFKPLKVDKLPEVGSDRILYLLPKNGLLSENLYDEYLWIDGVYEPVGTTAVDLSNYATVDDLSTKQNQLVVSGYLGSDVDWNTLTSTNIWIIGQASLDDDTTHGLGGVYGYGVLININDRSVNYQFYINDKYQVFLRTKYISWRSWTRLDFNGRPISDPTLDWNTLTSNGIYTIGYNGLIQEESHGPAGVSGWGVLTVTNTGLGQNQTACILQKYESPASGIYYRSLWNSSGDWSPWYKISSTAMTN